MLLSKEVEINLTGKTISYYEDLGYEIPRIKDKKGRLVAPRGTTIKIKIDDLLKGSNVLVKVQCDKCNDTLDVIYQAYNKCVHSDGKYYCNHCNNKVLNSKENNSKWNKNLSQEERELKRNTFEYAEWVKKVLARDNYTCQCCEKKSKGDVEAHHLDSWNWCIDKRYYETNGVTLCEDCHKNFHSICGYGDNTKEQFDEWIGHTIELLKFDGELPTTRKIYCIEEDKIYNSAEQIKKEWNLNNMSHIYDVCNHKVLTKKWININNEMGEYRTKYKTIKGKHLLWLDEYEKMTKEDVKNFIKKSNLFNKESIKRTNKMVICLTTNKNFNSVKEASEYYNCSYSGIGECCKGRFKSCGKLEDGIKLKWMYYEDYIKLNIEEKDLKVTN